MRKSIGIFALLLSGAALASDPVPTQPPTRGLLGSGPVVTVRQRTLAEVAREKPTHKGTVSQMDASVPAYQAPQLLSTTDGKAQVRGVENITFNAPPAQGTTHAPPIVGMSVEQQRGDKR